MATSDSEEFLPPEIDGFPLNPKLAMNPKLAEIHATAASFVYVLLKNSYLDEAQEFAEWFLETFDIDLED